MMVHYMHYPRHTYTHTHCYSCSRSFGRVCSIPSDHHFVTISLYSDLIYVPFRFPIYVFCCSVTFRKEWGNQEGIHRAAAEVEKRDRYPQVTETSKHYSAIRKHYVVHCGVLVSGARFWWRTFRKNLYVVLCILGAFLNISVVYFLLITFAQTVTDIGLAEDVAHFYFRQLLNAVVRILPYCFNSYLKHLICMFLPRYVWFFDKFLK